MITFSENDDFWQKITAWLNQTEFNFLDNFPWRKNETKIVFRFVGNYFQLIQNIVEP